MDTEEALDIFRALSNKSRIDVLRWLKNPEDHFPPQGEHVPVGTNLKGGVCVGSITEKCALSQSTVSHYLDMLQRAGLLKSERYGKWMYYRRDEKVISELAKYIKTDL
jgi:DNA-binding transcriptional ArsR family regulator